MTPPLTEILNSVCKLRISINIHFYPSFLDNHQPVTGLVAVIAIVVGFILAFFGIKLFRFLIAATAFVLFGIAGYIILINIHLHSYNYGPRFDSIIGWGVLGFGVFGAAMSGFLWKWILLGVGALAGVSLGLALFSGYLSINAASLPVWVRPVILGIMAIIGATLLNKFQRPLIIFGTAILGSLLLTFGLDTFVATGFNLIILAILTSSIDPTKIEIKDHQMMGMISLWIGSTILGIILQSKLTGKNVKSHTKN